MGGKVKLRGLSFPSKKINTFKIPVIIVLYWEFLTRKNFANYLAIVIFNCIRYLAFELLQAEIILAAAFDWLLQFQSIADLPDLIRVGIVALMRAYKDRS